MNNSDKIGNVKKLKYKNPIIELIIWLSRRWKFQLQLINQIHS